LECVGVVLGLIFCQKVVPENLRWKFQLECVGVVGRKGTR